MAPELDKVAKGAAGEWLIVKVNTDAVPELGERFRIRSIPTLAIFHGGREIHRAAGARSAGDIRSLVATNLDFCRGCAVGSRRARRRSALISSSCADESAGYARRNSLTVARDVTVFDIHRGIHGAHVVFGDPAGQPRERVAGPRDAPGAPRNARSARRSTVGNMPGCLAAWRGRAL